jgi:hypothetical protein
MWSSITVGGCVNLDLMKSLKISGRSQHAIRNINAKISAHAVQYMHIFFLKRPWYFAPKGLETVENM